MKSLIELLTEKQLQEFIKTFNNQPYCDFSLLREATDMLKRRKIKIKSLTFTLGKETSVKVEFIMNGEETSSTQYFDTDLTPNPFNLLDIAYDAIFYNEKELLRC